MEKKNRLMSLKTFEEFKSDNATYYEEVLNHFKEILAFITKNGVNSIDTKYNMKMIDAGDWRIEGDIVTSELHSEDDHLDEDVFFHNINGLENIDVNITGYGQTLVDKPGDDINPPEFEAEAHLNVESITLWKDNGDSNYSIIVSQDIEKIVLEIINIISK